MKRPKIILAFSGGLDTPSGALWLKNELGADVVTATVDTGGFKKKNCGESRCARKAFGAISHHELDGATRSSRASSCR